jgi:alpha-glucoside transport system permease protein
VGKILSTLLTVVVAVVGSAAIWVVANLIFDQVRRNWSTFRALIGAVCGFALGGILAGNRVIKGTQPGFLNWLWLPVVLAIVVALWFGIVTVIPNRTTRLVASLVIAAAIAVGLGLLVADGYQPALKTLPLIGWTVGGVAVGGALGTLVRKRNPLPGALLGGAVGSVIGGWGAANIGNGPTSESIAAFLIPALFLGARVGLAANAELPARLRIDRRSRAVIFLGPALLFILVTLVVPTIRTIYLSFLDDGSDEWVGLENYQETFRNPDTWNASDIGNVFTSKLFWIGIIALALALFFGIKNKAATGKAVEVGNSTTPPLVFGAMFCSFALFAALRGTISNNLWWVVTVTFLATGLGLAIAVLSDGARFERTAKSFIFLPMAISLVGASVIWRFMYVARDTSQDQTGVMNALWVGLGKLSTGQGIPSFIVGVLLIGLTVGLLVVLGKALTRRAGPGAMLAGGAAILLGWITLRYWGWLGEGIGGFAVRTADDGTTTIVPETVDFVQHQPFNNMWLMVVLIWMQTGFAMVILSAAIKAVPTEYIEAAKMDGATTSQIFWRITVPQIAPTIGVVVTTLIVTVMKVFDIIKVMTNGQFGTQVLANDMYQQAFQFTNYGRGAALAVILFLSVLPVMVLNIRRMQRES